MNHDNDPLLRLLKPLAGVLAATLIDVLVAALIGGLMPFDYAGRAWTYTGLVLYVIVGAVLVFRLTAEGERGQLSGARVIKWALSLWIWPLLALAARGRRRS